MAHRDGWFDASGDNASGVASMLGLAEHYSRIPQAQRKRTMVFVAVDGHHNSGEGSAVGTAWITQNGISDLKAQPRSRSGDCGRNPTPTVRLRGRLSNWRDVEACGQKSTC
jgi:hypothetical protein